MLTTLYIQIINTDDSGEYDYRGNLSNNEWASMMCNHINKSRQSIDPWAGRMEQYQYMISQARSQQERDYIEQRYGGMIQMGRQYNGMVEDYHEIETVGYDEGFGHRAQDVECLCEISDVEGNEINANFFKEHANDMFVLCLNIKPTDDDIAKSNEIADNMYDDRIKQQYIPWEDAEGEIRFWMKDSEGIIDDDTFDDDMKLKSLPGKRLRFKVNNEVYSASCCKIIEMRKEKNNPYQFVVLGDKMEKIG